MKQLAVVTAADPGRARELGTAARAFGTHEGWSHPAVLQTSGRAVGELIVWGADAGDVILPEQGQAAVLLGRAAYDEGGNRLSPSGVLGSLAESGTQVLGRIAAPQSLVVAFGQPVQLLVATDPIGLSAVYYMSRGREAAISSCSRLLAAILECQLDEDALSAFAALGAYPGAETPFRGVRRLGGGEYVRLDERGVVVEEYSRPATPHYGAEDLAGSVRDGVSAVCTGVEACVAAYPDASIELSGGLDSRLILAALLTAGHKPAEAVTLGRETDPDVVIAAEIASRAGIEQRRVDLAGIDHLGPDEAFRLVDNAGRRRDYSDNCVSLGVLDWVESSLGGGVRYSGQNGELARGYYYAFQPSWPRTADGLARALVRWRLTANERVSEDLLDPEVRAVGERHATATTQAFFERTRCDWLTATDLFYLYWRMQRWVGSDWTAAAQSRVILAPFFNSTFITWALSAAPHRKRGSRLLTRVLHEIDPELARLPTADGSNPVAVFNPNITDRIDRATRKARKAAVKVRQRFGAVTKPPMGADALARLALDGMRDEPLRLERVAALPFVSRQYIERLAEGGESASPPTVGLLVALSGLADHIAARPRNPPERLGGDLDPHTDEPISHISR